MRKSVNEKQRKCGQVYCQAPGAEPSLGLGQVEGSPEDETLRSPLLEKLVEGSLRAAENVRRQGGVRLPRAAHVQLRDLENRAGISVKRIHDPFPHEDTDTFPIHKST